MLLRTLTRNPVVGFSHDGYQKHAWYNVTQTQSGTVQAFDVRVYEGGNALALKGYLLSALPIQDISIGMTQPKRDHVGNSYQTLKILYGKSLHRGSFAPVKKKPPVHTGKSFGKAFDGGFE